jgi:hypothetical protein
METWLKSYTYVWMHHLWHFTPGNLHPFAALPYDYVEKSVKALVTGLTRKY